MRINEMNPQEKSVLLAKAAGIIEDRNLYYPANMALAWLVHLWGLDIVDAVGSWKYVSWWENMAIFGEDDAQRLWLDKVLELAIEAGLVEVDDAQAR